MDRQKRHSARYAKFLAAGGAKPPKRPRPEPVRAPRADTLARLLATPSLRAWAAEQIGQYVERRGPDECWEWGRSRFPLGYGRMKARGGAYFQTHRVAFALASGSSPGDLFVCHRCDNPPCCNPAHLFLGDNSANMADCARKGRTRLQRQPPTGEANIAAKLTAENVALIRQRIAGGESNIDIAADFGVTHSTISLIRRGKTWREVVAAAGIEPATSSV